MVFVFFSSIVTTNIDLQVNADLSKKHNKRKSGFHHEHDVYGKNLVLYDSSIVMMQPKITEYVAKSKRNSFPFNQVDDETKDKKSKKDNKDTDALTQYNFSRNLKKKYGKTKNHLTS